MGRVWIRAAMVLIGLLAAISAEAAAENNYHFLHVTISTPWYLFVFLLGGVLSPFVLMAALVWYSAMRKSGRKGDDSGPKSSVE